MSDTHDNLPAVEKAIRKFNEEDVDLVLHARNYVSHFVIPTIKSPKARLVGVFGNNDGDHEFLKTKFSENPKFEIKESFVKIDVGNIKIALLHGNDQELVNSLRAL